MMRSHGEIRFELLDMEIFMEEEFEMVLALANSNSSSLNLSISNNSNMISI